MANTYYDSELTGEQIEQALAAIDELIVPANNGKIVTVQNGKLVAKSASEWGGGAVLESLSVTENGDYYPGTDIDGFDEVHVSVPSSGGNVNKTKQNSIFVSCFAREGYIGGFNQSSAIWQPADVNGIALDIDWSKAFKIHVKFKLTQIKSGSQCLFGTYTPQQFYRIPSIEIQSADRFWFGISTNGSSWTDTKSITDIPIVAGNTYEIDMDYNGSSVVITITDGTNIKTTTMDLSGTPTYSTSYKIGFGNNARSNSLYAQYVYFDPDETYIESQGTVVWGTKKS